MLRRTLHRWVNTCNVTDAEMFVESWRKSIEAELEGVTLEEHCKQNDIKLPDLIAEIPTFVRVSSLRRTATHRQLKAHRAGPFGEWIWLLLYANRKQSRSPVNQFVLQCEWGSRPFLPGCSSCGRRTRLSRASTRQR